MGRGSKLVHSINDFKMADWIAVIDKDYECLNGILSRVEGIGPDDDDKLQAFETVPVHGRRQGREGADLLRGRDHHRIPVPGTEPRRREIPEISKLTGSNRHEAESIIKRFAPTWNLSSNESRPGPEIRVLLATDIVSEGQNLQDCARVLNYDLHWNPVRLIQRFGRVDRIGTEHEIIHLHNMWPDTAVDAGLSLTDRLNRRIQTFHDLIGLDSRLLSDAERLNANAMYRIYEGKELPELDDGLDDLAANQRAIALLQRIQEDDPDLWRTITSLPDGIRSALGSQVRSCRIRQQQLRPERSFHGGRATAAHLAGCSGCRSLAF